MSGARRERYLNALGFGLALAACATCAGGDAVGPDVPADGGGDAGAEDNAGRPDDGGRDDSECTSICYLDFPCTGYFHPECVDRTTVTACRDLSCEEACGPGACCSGSTSWIYDQPCGEGTECRRSAYSATGECAATCGAMVTFADGIVPLRELRATPTGDDATADGSAEQPFRTIAAAAARAEPGDRILLVGSESTEPFEGGIVLTDLHGTAERPIWISGGDLTFAHVRGGTVGLHLVRPQFVVLEDLAVYDSVQEAIRIDDGGDPENPAVGVVLRRTSPGPAADPAFPALRLQGVVRFSILDGYVEAIPTWMPGPGGGMDLVGCRDGVVAGNRLRQLEGFGIRVRGGSSNVRVTRNQLDELGGRAIVIGGATEATDLRPADATAEARDVLAYSNIVHGGSTAIVFAGADGCLAANNTIIRPTLAVAAILQESATTSVACGHGRFINNLSVFSRFGLATVVELGADTAPETFTFANNLWFAEDDPAFTGPELPTPETGTVVADPLLADSMDPPYGLTSGSPAIRAGLDLVEVTSDYGGFCRGSPPDIGAHDSGTP